MTNIIKVKFFKGDIPAGREYTYYTPEPVNVGDVVDIETNHGKARAMVSQINVPEKEIEAFKDKAKSIIGKATKKMNQYKCQRGENSGCVTCKYGNTDMYEEPCYSCKTIGFINCPRVILSYNHNRPECDGCKWEA